MRRFLLAGTAFLGFAASGSVANAVPITFNYPGSLVDFTVPATGTYQILAFGAQGWDGRLVNFLGQNIVNPGGDGAEIGGTFSLTVGEVLQIAVGGSGGDGVNSGGGGGGSFVVGPGNMPLIIAGGGGGNGSSFGALSPAPPAQGGLAGQDGGRGFPGGGAGLRPILTRFRAK